MQHRLIVSLLSALLWLAPGVSPAQSNTTPADVLKGLGEKLLGGASEPEFLDPDEAFVVDVVQADDQTLVASWHIAEGYYLYRDKFKLLPLTTGDELGAIDFPAGEKKEDLAFGMVEIYRGAVELGAPLVKRLPQPHVLDLKVGYQGCADDGICYPPIEKQIRVDLAAAGALTPSPRPAAAPGGEVARSEQDRIADALKSGAVSKTVASFFVFGLLLALTPCVFPMIPILSGLIVGAGRQMSTLRAFVLSAVYVLAMALTYALAGVAAAGFGQNLQATFQAPGVIVGFSLVFILLALSMFGLFELQLPSGLQTRLSKAAGRQRRGTLSGVAVMGVLSAVIVGPCIAPPLAGALIYIGQTGDLVLGGLALFCMALGMGMPLLFVGASAGHLLPRAGPWMETIKRIFGVVLLGVALWLLERILPPPVTVFLAGLLLIGTAVYIGAFDQVEPQTNGWRRLGKALGITSLLYGSVLVIAAAGGAKDVFRPLQTMEVSPGGAARPTEIAFIPIKGVAGLELALARAKAENKTTMLDFYADWCIECKRLEKNTFSDAAVSASMRQLQLLKADVTANDAQDRRLLAMLGLYGPPATLFFGPDAAELRALRLAGYIEAEAFNEHLRKVLQ